MKLLQFPQQFRIKKGSEIKIFFDTGQRIVSHSFFISYLEKEQDGRRFGFIVGKKIGSAVIRTKLKRRLREIVRQYQHQINKRYDMIFVAKSQIKTKSMKELEKELVEFIQDEGLWIE